jgi:hypothetical protein
MDMTCLLRKDTDPASWASILKEMEDEGVTEYTINSHTVVHASGGNDDMAAYTITAKAEVVPLIFKWVVPTSVSYQSCASLFTSDVLDKAALKKMWRISFREEDGEFSPKCLGRPTGCFVVSS